ERPGSGRHIGFLIQPIMDRASEVQAIIFSALRSLNHELPESSKVPVSVDTRLFGPAAQLDSMSLISVIIDVEGGVSEKFGREVALTDDRALSQPVSPFSSVTTLSAYILTLLGESGDKK